MKFHLNSDDNINLINAYGTDHVVINGQRYRGNLVVTATEIVTDWALPGFDSLSASDFDAILKLQPEVVLIGTGARQRFPAPAVLRPLIDTNTGFEIMDIAAACRTYTLLVSERRAVAAALLFDASVS